ncbi:putative reverse transcriptase domain-containing protein, partial [Tanacetum coccineum]
GFYEQCVSEEGSHPDDTPLVSVYTTGNVLVRGMLIPDVFLTNEIRVNDDFKEYETVFIGVDVPIDQLQPGKKRKQTAGESSSLHKSLKITIRQKQVVEGEKDDDDSEDRLEPESHKENPEYVDDDDDKEKVDEEKDVDMGSLETRIEEMQTPIPTPPRSPRINLTLNKNITQELTDIVPLPTATTSKTPHSKRRISRMYSHLPSALSRMCRRQGYTIQNMEQKATNDLIENNLKPSIAVTIIKDRDAFCSEIPDLVSQEFVAQAPKIIEELFKNYVQSNVIQVHPITTTSTETTSTADLQQQLYLKMKRSLQDQANDPVLWEDAWVEETVIDNDEATLNDMLSNQFKNDEEYRDNSIDNAAKYETRNVVDPACRITSEGERVGRREMGRRPKEGNDERVEDLNGHGNDQGLGANRNLLPAMLAQIMSPRMRTRSAGRPAAESLGGGTGVRVGKGGRDRRPREGNDERVDELNGHGNDQGLGANRGVEGVNGNVEGANRGAPDFSKIIAQQLQNLLPAMLVQISNRGNVGNQNGNVVNKNVQKNIENVIVNGNRVGCSYKKFLACNPKDYDGKGGDVVLTRWIEKMESVHNMSGCSIDQKVKYTAGSFFMMIQEFCPSHEMQKLESELWNHAMVGAGHAAYTDRFHDLARLVPHLVTLESRMIERFVYGLPLQILGMVAATEPKTMQKAVQISGALTDEAVRNGSIKKVEKKGNVGEPSKDRSGRDDNKRTRIGNVFATTINPVGRENTGTWLKCTTCNSYHAPGGPCRTCFNCNHPGYLAKDCRGVPRNVNPVYARNLIVRACYECGSTDHVRSACPRLNRAQGPEENCPNKVAANNGG